MLTNLAVSAELFHTADGTAFADLMIDGHRETWPVRSIRIRSWLRRKYYEATGAAAAAGAISSALDLLEARAQFDAPQRAIYLRVAEHDGRIYLDLADERWRAVEIGPDGWQVITRPPVRFRRAAGMLPLPMPIRGGSLEALAPFFNVANRRRLRFGRGVAAGGVTTWRPLPAAGRIRRTGIGQDGLLQNASRLD